MEHKIMGEFDPNKIKRPKKFFIERYIFLDCRGDLEIGELSHWGFGVKVITLTHDISSGEFVQVVQPRKTIVENYAWIGSFALLYNSHIKHHGIVACGAVVRNTVVQPYTIVAGNPAKVVSLWDEVEEKWQRV